MLPLFLLPDEVHLAEPFPREQSKIRRFSRRFEMAQNGTIFLRDSAKVKRPLGEEIRFPLGD